MMLEPRGEPAQEALGRQLAGLLRPPLIVYLEGDLGTGKTTLTRGILRGLGHNGTVRSPTFTLLEPYDLGRWRLFHLDLYRLADPEELHYLGLRGLLDQDSVLIVEWPQRGGLALPPADLEIRLATGPMPASWNSYPMARRVRPWWRRSPRTWLTQRSTNRETLWRCRGIDLILLDKVKLKCYRSVCHPLGVPHSPRPDVQIFRSLHAPHSPAGGG